MEIEVNCRQDKEAVKTMKVFEMIEGKSVAGRVKIPFDFLFKFSRKFFIKKFNFLLKKGIFISKRREKSNMV
jgi:hypothetical protein